MLGRETFADEVVWEDGWPVLTGHVEPAPPPDRAVTEALDGALPPSWVGASRFPSEFVTAEDGALRVTGDGEPVFVGRRQEHLHARVRARLDVEGAGGIAVRIDPTHAVELEVSGGRVRAVWAVGAVRHVLGESDLPADGELEIRLLPDESGNPFLGRGPDIVVAGVVARRCLHRARPGRRPLPLHRGRRRHDRPDARRRRAATAPSWSGPSSTRAPTTRRPCRDRRPRRPAARLR